jgi:hypothetical protein
MFPIFIVILAAFGAAFAFRGRQMRGLCVLLAANLGGVAGFALRSYWGWMAFSCCAAALCVAGMVAVRRDL